jgi:hypothetical protein
VGCGVRPRYSFFSGLKLAVQVQAKTKNEASRSCLHGEKGPLVRTRPCVSTSETAQA